MSLGCLYTVHVVDFKIKKSRCLFSKRIKWLVSKETLCCVGGQVKQLVDYQLEVDKGKLTAVANLKS